MTLRPLLRIARGHALHRPLQSILLVAGVALGVAVVVAIDLANESALAAFNLSTEAVSGRATHRIVGGAEGLDEALYVRLRTDPAIDARASAPVVEGYVTVAELGGRPMTLLGLDPFAEPPFRAFFDAGGALPTEALGALLAVPGTVLVAADVAAEAGVAAGGALTADVAGRPVRLTVAAVLDPPDDLSRRALAGLVLADIATAQEVLGRVGRLDRIDLVFPEGGTAGLDALSAALPPGAAIEAASDQQAAVAGMTDAFRLNLTALSLLALLVGMFLIFNTVRFSVVRRRRTLATLRALGVTGGELFGAVLIEAALLGALGAALGVALGVVLGRGAVALVTRTINDLYFVVTVTDVAVAPLGLARGAALGVAAALVAALLPAWEATRVPPVTALRRSSQEAAARRGVPRALAGALALLGAGGAVLAVPGGSALLGLLGLGAVVMAFALTAPAVTLGLMALVARLTRRLGIVARMAPRDVARALSRTAVAAAALMVALCVSIGVSVMVGSFRSTVERWMADTLRADVFVSGRSTGGPRVAGGFEPGLAAELGALPEVAGLYTARAATLRSPDLGHIDATAFAEDVAGDTRPYLDAIGSPADVARAMDGGAVAISEPLARRHGLRVGDVLTLSADDGPRAFPVAAVFYDYGSERGQIYLRDAVYRDGWADDRLSAVALTLRPGVDADAFAAALGTRLSDRGVDVRSNRGLRAEVLRVFDQAFAITTALQLLAIVVAFVGVLSSLMALQLERARDNATLRALGLTGRQLAALSTLQTGLVGLVAGLLSWPAGLSLSMILIYVINRRSFGWTIQPHLDPLVFARALGLALVAALLAGAWPAWRLSRQPIAASLREE